jgi:hypothetical protein
MQRLASDARLLVCLCVAGLALLLTGQGFSLSERVAAQSAEIAPTTLFADVTDQAGLSGNRRGTDRAIGAAWGDYDNDGWVDLYVTDTAGPNTLFRNNGDGTFSRVEMPAIALPDAYSGGAVFADYDNDGWLDLYVANWGFNHLFRNVNGIFVDVTEEAGVAGRDANSQTASWGDFDGDGFLDLYVANWACYPRCGRPMTGESDRLYRNNGDGTFTDITSLLGSKVMGAGFVASFIDYDNDGDLDIYLINDEFINPVGNALWRNDGPGCNGWCLTEVSAAAGADTRLMGMGLAAFDYNNSGHIDFYFSNAGPMALLRNRGDGSFSNVAADAGVASPTAIGWGTVAFDYNNDGYPDLYLAVMEGVRGRDATNPLFRNNGDGAFSELLMSGANDGHSSLGVATADFDGDGRLDLLVGNINPPGYRLYRNLGRDGAGHNWLRFHLTGGGPINRDAIGTRISLIGHDGRRQMQELQAGSSLGSGNEMVLHFGLGQAESADITIRWPDGSEQTVRNVRANQRYDVQYGASALDTWRTFRQPVLSASVPALGIALLLLGGALFFRRIGRIRTPIETSG